MSVYVIYDLTIPFITTSLHIYNQGIHSGQSSFLFPDQGASCPSFLSLPTGPGFSGGFLGPLNFDNLSIFLKHIKVQDCWSQQFNKVWILLPSEEKADMIALLKLDGQALLGVYFHFREPVFKVDSVFNYSQLFQQICQF